MKILFILVLICISNISGLNFGIIDGQDAKEAQFPYQISLQECTTFIIETCTHICGGSIISPKWIVTAGHCHDYPRKFQVVAGIYKLDEKSEFKQTVVVKQIIINENYIGNDNPNDIALLELAEPLNYTERVKPINLPVPNYETTGPAIASGWGLVGRIFQRRANVLQWAELPIISGADCMGNITEAVHHGRNPFNITTNVCTADTDKSHGLCKGDSGGPLVQNDTLIGISSWGILPCGTTGAPSAYTKVSNYIYWINNHTNIFQNL